jgi:hypothetical protein
LRVDGQRVVHDDIELGLVLADLPDRRGEQAEGRLHRGHRDDMPVGDVWCVDDLP